MRSKITKKRVIEMGTRMVNRMTITEEAAATTLEVTMEGETSKLPSTVLPIYMNYMWLDTS